MDAGESFPRPATRRIRVLVNAVHARAGGGLTYLRNLLPLLAEEPDLELHLIPHPSQAAELASLVPRITVHRMALPASWIGLLLWEQLILPMRARRIGYDVLFSPANFGPLAVRRQVVVLHNAPTVGRLERRIGKRLYWAALGTMTALSLRRSRRAIAVSRYVAESAAGRWTRRAVPAMIHHGADASFGPGEAEEPEGRFLLAVGDLYVQKNSTRLIEALAVLRRTHGDVTLRIAGAAIDSQYAGGLRALVAEHRLGEAVSFLGRCDRETLARLYRSCAAFVFPSLEESFGMPLVEAMACGAPVIAARSAATPEITAGAAVLFDPNDPEDIADAISRVLEDDELRTALRRQSLDRAAQFSWEDCARLTAAVLRDAAG